MHLQLQNPTTSVGGSHPGAPRVQTPPQSIGEPHRGQTAARSAAARGNEEPTGRTTGAGGSTRPGGTRAPGTRKQGAVGRSAGTGCRWEDLAARSGGTRTAFRLNAPVLRYPGSASPMPFVPLAPPVAAGRIPTGCCAPSSALRPTAGPSVPAPRARGWARRSLRRRRPPRIAHLRFPGRTCPTRPLPSTCTR